MSESELEHMRRQVREARAEASRARADAARALRRLSELDLHNSIDREAEAEARRRHWPAPTLAASVISRRGLALDATGRVPGLAERLARVEREAPGLLSAPDSGGTPSRAPSPLPINGRSRPVPARPPTPAEELWGLGGYDQARRRIICIRRSRRP